MNENQRRAARKAKRPAGYADGGVVAKPIEKMSNKEKIAAAEAEARAMGRGETIMKHSITRDTGLKGTFQQETLKRRLGEEK